MNLSIAFLAFIALSFQAVADDISKDEQPTAVAAQITNPIPDVFVPIYCLTKLTPEEKSSYTTAITNTWADISGYTLPDFNPWTEDHDGKMQDLYRIWNETGGHQYNGHFAFFIDRTAVANTSIIIAQPDVYTMVFNSDASHWLQSSLSSYYNRKGLAYPGDIDPATAPRGSYEYILETMLDDLLDNRGLTYGRVPASAFRSVQANLEIANMGMSELVEYHGGRVEMIDNPGFDENAVMEKLDTKIRGHLDNGGVPAEMGPIRFEQVKVPGKDEL